MTQKHGGPSPRIKTKIKTHALTFFVAFALGANLARMPWGVHKPDDEALFLKDPFDCPDVRVPVDELLRRTDEVTQELDLARDRALACESKLVAAERHGKGNRKYSSAVCDQMTAPNTPADTGLRVQDGRLGGGRSSQEHASEGPGVEHHAKKIPPHTNLRLGKSIKGGESYGGRVGSFSADRSYEDAFWGNNIDLGLAARGTIDRDLSGGRFSSLMMTGGLSDDVRMTKNLALRLGVGLGLGSERHQSSKGEKLAISYAMPRAALGVDYGRFSSSVHYGATGGGPASSALVLSSGVEASVGVGRVAGQKIRLGVERAEERIGIDGRFVESLLEDLIFIQSEF